MCIVAQNAHKNPGQIQQCEHSLMVSAGEGYYFYNEKFYTFPLFQFILCMFTWQNLPFFLHVNPRCEFVTDLLLQIFSAENVKLNKIIYLVCLNSSVADFPVVRQQNPQ